MNDRAVTAVFESREQARRAIDELRTEGLPESAISIIGQPDENGDDQDTNTSGAVKGALLGAGAGALLGIAALAIPGVGPLVAAGAIAASAVPEAAAIGAAAGAATGGLGGLLTKHGVSDDDARYYEDRINSGGTLVSVDADEAEKAGVPTEMVREILYRSGGESATQSRSTFA